MSHDEYKKLDRISTPVEACPCCGSSPELWQYSKSPTDPTEKVVCCVNGDPIGPQDGVFMAGCPLYMPPQQHYCATEREAIKFWNEFAVALTSLQRKNRWAHAKVMRTEP